MKKAISTGSMNYAYDKTGKALPIGTPTVRNFATNEYAFYISDSWRLKPGLTLTSRILYENYTPPGETTRPQVTPPRPCGN